MPFKVNAFIRGVSTNTVQHSFSRPGVLVILVYYWKSLQKQETLNWSTVDRW